MTHKLILKSSTVDGQEATIISQTLNALASLNKQSSLVLPGRNSVLIGR